MCLQHLTYKMETTMPPRLWISMTTNHFDLYKQTRDNLRETDGNES